MKGCLYALAGLLAFSISAADARARDEGGNSSNSNHNTAIAGAAASAKASASASSRSSASAKQAQGQLQGQAQQQGQQLGQTITHNEARVAPGFSAPSLAASDEACMGSTSGGVGVSAATIGVSATFGTTWESVNCNLRMFAQQLRLAGAPDAAILLLANHPQVKAALQATGKIKPDPVAAPIQGPTQSGAPVSAPAAAGKHPACSPSSWASREWRAANCT